MRHLTLALAILAVVTACESPTGPFVEGAVPMDPLPAYRTWYAEMEECSELSGDFRQIRWYMVPGVWAWEHEGNDVRGLWRSNHEIYVGEHSLQSKELVQHEMLHDLVQADGHPVPPFGECAAVP